MTKHFGRVGLLGMTLLLTTFAVLARADDDNRSRRDPAKRVPVLRSAPVPARRAPQPARVVQPEKPSGQQHSKAARRPAGRKPKVQRVGSVIGLNRQTTEQYVILHRHVWPEVLEQIRKSNIRNYSIYMGELDDGNVYLFSYFEYVGDDFEADMQAMAADPSTREWWKLTDPLQKRVKNTPAGDQWKTIEEVFHTD